MTSPESEAPTHYKKPPIVEAVLAIHFADSVLVKSIDAFAIKRKSRFPRIEDVIDTTFVANTKGTVDKNTSKKVGVKLTSGDGSRVIIFRENQFALIHLPPYTDWDSLYDEALNHWEAATKIIKHKSIAFFSTRYVNRIDIPVDSNGGVDLGSYFKIGINLPDDFTSVYMQQFNSHSILVDKDGRYRVVLQFSSAPPALIDHMSFTIDIDLITLGGHSRKDSEAWAFLRSLRKVKNDLFEACITEATRDLFR